MNLTEDLVDGTKFSASDLVKTAVIDRARHARGFVLSSIRESLEPGSRQVFTHRKMTPLLLALAVRLLVDLILKDVEGMI